MSRRVVISGSGSSGGGGGSLSSRFGQMRSESGNKGPTYRDKVAYRNVAAEDAAEVAQEEAVEDAVEAAGRGNVTTTLSRAW
eukprot:CAMPEP_0168532026 /NCGR_PEP_ID=MMETSP0405-20121227/15913_1 /TAXON_ID=498012 /ORGANISM="Trichosphaerium sp, Strain Am-I-7 wt" /LENGTH=81 /DNA_ID=CAMNT_0008557171 /DNA_START=99 /DNA_END=342 /DNA_ORIENTATION=+